MSKLFSKIRVILWRLSMKGFPRGPHITRFFMYNRLQDVGKSLSKRKGDVLSISHSKILCEIMNILPTTLVEANYPDQNILSLQFPDESFDFVFSDQVLEHVEGDPQQAIDESYRVLRPGGIAIHTTCFINPIHGSPSDYWRFTPEALRFLVKKFSNVIECDGWGNFESWRIIRDGLRFDGVPLTKFHPLNRIAIKNDPEWPIVTWIVAQK